MAITLEAEGGGDRQADVAVVLEAERIVAEAGSPSRWNGLVDTYPAEATMRRILGSSGVEIVNLGSRRVPGMIGPIAIRRGSPPMVN